MSGADWRVGTGRCRYNLRQNLEQKQAVQRAAVSLSTRSAIRTGRPGLLEGVTCSDTFRKDVRFGG